LASLAEPVAVERSRSMKHAERHVPTLEEALRQPCKHRDMALALEPMPNFSSTPGGPHGQPLAFWAAWDLEDRPRRIACSSTTARRSTGPTLAASSRT
jgi:hypothetical protein